MSGVGDGVRVRVKLDQVLVFSIPCPDGLN